MSNANDTLIATELKKILNICLRNLYEQLGRIQPQLQNPANVPQSIKLKATEGDLEQAEDLVIKTSIALRAFKKKEGGLPRHNGIKTALELLDVVDLIDGLLQICGDKINRLDREKWS